MAMAMDTGTGIMAMATAAMADTVVNTGIIPAITAVTPTTQLRSNIL